MRSLETIRQMGLATLLACLGAAGCRGSDRPEPVAPAPFDADVAFLRHHTRVLLLIDRPGAARVAVAPEYQGRVMTSTTGGDDAPRFGWIGREAIASRARQPHMNVFGGEDRFWLGPEGGQYSLYFKPGDPFDLDHWQVPEPIDWGNWDVAGESATAVRFRKRMTLVNYAGTQIQIEVDRNVRWLSGAEIATQLRASPATEVRIVAFESVNTVTNVGSEQWQPKSGLVSVWILGMFNPSPATTVAIPIV
jgi:hypothetical protein